MKAAVVREFGKPLPAARSRGLPIQEIGEAHDVLVTAPSSKAFEQALGMVRRGGTIVLNGLPTW